MKSLGIKKLELIWLKKFKKTWFFIFYILFLYKNIKMRRQRKRMENHFKYNDNNRYNKDILLSYNKTYDDF